jgi:hypothetical protein
MKSPILIQILKRIVGLTPRRRGGSGGPFGEAYVAVSHHLMNDVSF